MPNLRIIERAHRGIAGLRARPLDVLGVTLAILYALPSLWYPTSNDVAIHWYIGRGLLDGEIPYAAGVDTRPPGVFYTHAASILAFGDHQASVRIMDLLFVLGCAALVATFGMRTLRNGAVHPKRLERAGNFGAAALLVSGIHYTFNDDYAVGHPELWQAFFMLGSLWTVIRVPDGKPRTRDVVGAAVFAATAVMFKHTAAFTGVLAAIGLVALAFRAWGSVRALKVAGIYSATVFITLFVLLLPFTLTGNLEPLYEVMVRFIISYAGHASEGVGTMMPPWMTSTHGGFIVVVALALWLMGAGIAARTADRTERAVGRWIALAVLVVFGTVFIQIRPMVSLAFAYHFVVVGPFLALAVHWGICQRFVRAPRARLIAVVAIVALGLSWGPEWPFSDGWSYRREWASWVEHVRGEGSPEERLHRYGFRRNALDRYGRHARVGEWIAGRAAPGDTLYVRGMATPIYQITGLRCPSRHFSEDTVATGLPEWEAQRDRDLEASPPSFVVTFSDRRSEIQPYLARGYTLHEVETGHRVRYVVLERPRDGA